MEEWKEIDGWAGKYLISNFGRMKSLGGKYSTKCPDGYITEGSIDVLGYRCITMRSPGRREQKRVHSLVASAFLEKPSPLHCVNHKDGNKLNNHVDNLEWITKKENCLHAVRIGLHNLKGEHHPMAKLTEKDVLRMRKLRLDGQSYERLGKRFGVSRRQAADVVNGKNWGWLK